MFDPFNIQITPNSDFVVIDYLNGKYQGEINQKKSRQGFGIALDHNYLLTLSTWKDNQVQGPAFIVFPDCSFFYGQLNEGLANGISTFHSSKGYNIYCHFLVNQKSIFIFDDTYNKSLQSLEVSSEILKKAMGKQVSQNYLAECYKSKQKGLEIKSQLKYDNLEDKMKQIEKIFSSKLQPEDLSFSKFIRKYLSHNQSVKLQITEAKNEFMFKFQGSSIVCKIISQNENHQIKQISFKDFQTGQAEIYKKYQGNSIYQQGIHQESLKYSSNQRPSQCSTALHLYFKQSLNFVNQCISIDYLYKLKFIFYSLQQLKNEVFLKIQGHHLLENIANFSIKEESVNQQRISKVKQFSLSEVKDDIYTAVRKTSLSNSHRSKYRSYDHQKNSEKKSKSTSQSIYDYILRNSAGTKQTQKKAKTSSPYKTDTRPPWNSNLKQTSFKTQKKSQKLQKTQKIKTNQPLSKFAYLSDSREVNLKRINNINTLTEYYEAIQQDLKKDSSGISTKLFTNFSAKPYQYDHQTGEFSRVINNESIAGPRKMLQYGWK